MRFFNQVFIRTESILFFGPICFVEKISRNIVPEAEKYGRETNRAFGVNRRNSLPSWKMFLPGKKIAAAPYDDSVLQSTLSTREITDPISVAWYLRVYLSGDGHLCVSAAGECLLATGSRDHDGVDMDVCAAAAAATVKRHGGWQA